MLQERDNAFFISRLNGIYMGISLSLFDESAEKTLKTIDDAIKQDNGSEFKKWEKAYFSDPNIDAWRADKKGELRDHLGASQIGDECERKAWLKFRTAETECDPRLVRLWNRGHLEEMRFMALLQQAGIQAWNYDADRGRQFGYSQGIFAGSIDGLAYGVPEYPDELVMLEFKTMSDKNYNMFLTKGISSFPHYEKQCQVNMLCMNRLAGIEGIYDKLNIDAGGKEKRIKRTLFMAVNKNTDEIHAVFVELEPAVAETVLGRIETICRGDTLPEKLSENRSFWLCRMCEFNNFCFGDAELQHNCRTCMLQKYDPETQELACSAGGDKFAEECYMGIGFEVR